MSTESRARGGEDHRITPLELFFDLAMVFAFTQVTRLVADDPSWGGVLRGMLVLAALWWAWNGYAWLSSASHTWRPSASERTSGRLLATGRSVPRALSRTSPTVASSSRFMRATSTRSWGRQTADHPYRSV